MAPDTVRDRLRAEILSGALPCGTVLMQGDLARRFGVSRIPVRDALAALAADRLVEIRPNQRAAVVSLGRNTLAELFEMRLLLEPHLIALACTALSDDDLDAIDHARRKSDLEAGRPGWAVGDWAFHEALYRPAARPRMLESVRDLRRICQVHVLAYDRLTTRTDHWLDQHRKLARAMADRNLRRAARHLRQHLEDARDHLLDRMPDAV